MRLSLGDFEELRQNPSALKQKKLSGKRSGPSYTPSAALRNTILWTHKNGKDRIQARTELEHKYKIGNFGPRIQKSESALARLIGQLEEYLDDHSQLQLQPIHLRERIRLPLPPEVGESIRITGEIPRIEASLDGRIFVWFFASKTANWREELRFPIIQAAVADQVGAPSDEVLVGVYCFEDGAHHSFQFTEDEITAARKELLSLLRFLM